MVRLLAIGLAVLLCGCISGGGEDVEVVDVGPQVTDATNPMVLEVEPTTTVKSKPYLPPDSSTTTSTAPAIKKTSATTTTVKTLETSTTTSSTSTSTTSSTTSTSSTTTSASTTTLPCAEQCDEIRYPSPDNCVRGCCISDTTRCQYVPGGGSRGGRCRCF